MQRASVTLFNVSVNGEGVSEDGAEAVKSHLKAGEQDFATGQFNLGLMYTTGKGFSRDHALEAQWWC